MHIILSSLILILSFQFSSMADDISDFQIEGISIGDSLLNYMTIKEIKLSKRNYLKNKKYYVVGYNKDLKTYSQVDIYLKKGDNKYIVKTLSGTIFMQLNECLGEKKKIVNELSEIFLNASEKTYNKVPHSYDKTGKSLQYQTGFLLKNSNDDDHIRVECTDWSNKFTTENGWTDNLSVSAFSKEILNWFKMGYN